MLTSLQNGSSLVANENIELAISFRFCLSKSLTSSLRVCDFTVRDYAEWLVLIYVKEALGPRNAFWAALAHNMCS